MLHFNILVHLVIETPGNPGIAVYNTGKGRDIHGPFDLLETIPVVLDLELKGIVIPGSGNKDICREFGPKGGCERTDHGENHCEWDHETKKSFALNHEEFPFQKQP